MDLSDGCNGSPSADHDHWAGIVTNIRAGEASGIAELHRVFSNGVRLLLQRQLGAQILDDQVDEVLLTVAAQIWDGDLKEPERLAGYVRTVVQHQVLKRLGQRRPDSTPTAAGRNNEEAALRVLKALSPRDRELLIRFYLQEQPQEQICQEMGLTLAQFREIKSRAKGHFDEFLNAKFQPKKAPESWRKFVPWMRIA